MYVTSRHRLFQADSPNYSYDGGVIVDRSIDLGEPVVYVSMNYR